MSEKKQNPFAEPVKTRTKKHSKFELADFTQHAQSFLSWKIFKAGNRIGRLRYLSFTLGTIFFGAALGLMAFLIPVIGHLLSALLLIPVIGHLLSALLLIATYIAIAIFTVKRCHDFNLHTLLALALLVFIPIVVVIFFLIPGNKKENIYGVAPPENSTAVVVFAFLLPILYGLFVSLLILLTFSIPLCFFCS